jgi:anti-anti-sigma regulatory factor
MWADELNVLKQATGRQVILDFSQTWFVSTKAVMTLIALMPDHLYVLNCPMEMRNIMLSAGLSERML